MFGFEMLGMQVPAKDLEYSGHVVTQIPFNSHSSLEDANGLIIPSGIFEQIEFHTTVYGEKTKRFKYQQLDLATREKQLFNAIRRGAWVAFLLESVDTDSGRSTETDLAKKCLAMTSGEIISHFPDSHIDCKSDAFKAYMDRFGIARTTFRLPKNLSSFKVLASTTAGSCVAIADSNRVFFLPFLPAKKTSEEIASLAKLVTESVSEFIRKNEVVIEEWIRDLTFATERKCVTEIELLNEKIEALSRKVESYNKYKAILSTSGSKLNEIVVEILRDYFHLNLDHKEHFIEDALIFSDDNSVDFVVEVKGINGGLKRDRFSPRKIELKPGNFGASNNQ